MASLLLAIATVLAVVASLSVLLPASPAAAEEEWAERRTEHLVLRFRPADATEVDWYASFVEQTYRYVSEVFGQPLRPGLIVTFYGNEADFAEVNPIGGNAEGVLAHARPSTREIGLAIWRLRRQNEVLRQDAVRHEMTHIVLGELSDQKLPIGFQEGVAQYVERDLEQRRTFGRIVGRAADAGQLLDFGDLNRQRVFLSRANVAYPQSYAVAVFLSDRYGFGSLVRLTAATADASSLEDAVQRTYGRSLAELEAEWSAALPDFLNGGWARNQLDIWELEGPRQLLVEGRFAEAREGFERAARLFEDLGRAEKLEQARTYLRQSEAGVEAIDLSQRGANALAVNDYVTALDLLERASARWAEAGHDGPRQQVGEGVDQARRGLAAIDQLLLARDLLDGWRLSEASQAALEAGAAFADLGDVARTEEAGAVLDDVQALKTRAGIGALGAGAVGLVVGGFVWLTMRRPRRGSATYRPSTGLQARGQDWSL